MQKRKTGRSVLRNQEGSPPEADPNVKPGGRRNGEGTAR